MENKYSIVITTTASLEEAEKITKKLLSQKLAACVQLSPIQSFYNWKGEVKNENEQLLYIKSKSENYSKIESCIKENHSYEIPEIIQIPISSGLPAYLNWITKETE